MVPMRIGPYLIIYTPRSLHPWRFGKRPYLFYLGPIMFYNTVKRERER